MPTPLRRIHRLNRVLTPVLDLAFACLIAGVVFVGVKLLFDLFEFLR